MVLWKVNEEDCGGMSAGRFKEVIARRPITLTVGWPQTDEPQMAADAGALGDQTPIQAAKAKHKHQWPLMSPEERKGAVQAEVSGHQAKLSAAMEQSPLGLSGLSGGAARTQPPVRC